MIPDTRRIQSFESAKDFERWLSKHHDKEPEIWLKVHKKGSGLPTVTLAEALDIVLCWGWIDAIRKSFDENSFLQRYCPRGPRSVWSQINRDHIARLVAAGRMTAHGQRHVDAAKADGRWDNAYAPMREATHDSVPEDLRKAINANAKAKALFANLNRSNLFALRFRVENMKTPTGRAKKIADLVAMLARGETITPLGAAKQPAAKPAKQPAAKPAKQPAAKPAKRPAAKPSR